MAVSRRIVVGISAVAAVAVVGLIILAAVLRPSGSRPAKRPERLQAQPQVADTDSGPVPVTYDQKKVDEWIRQLEDKGEGGDVRRKAAELLGRTGDPRVVPALLKALEDKQYTVRRDAANALGRIGDQRAVQPLIEALEDKQDSVRQAAARALGKIDDPQAKRALRKEALGRTAAKVGSFVIELLLLCLLTFLLALGWWVLKRRQSIPEININLMLVYLGVVGVVSCATVLIEYVTSSREGLKPFLARIIVWPACLLRLMVGSRFGAWPVVLFGCLVYYGIIFRPLLKASYLNERRGGARYSALRRLFIVHCLIPIVLFAIVAICLVAYAIVHIREAPLH
ncbi:MAG: HEAT repeat domain-containing protein [Planctomycetota bacterium]